MKFKVSSHCDWAVCFTIPAETQDDRQPVHSVVAWFQYPHQAEEFIQKVLPDETRDQFYVMHRNLFEKER